MASRQYVYWMILRLSVKASAPSCGTSVCRPTSACLMNGIVAANGISPWARTFVAPREARDGPDDMEGPLGGERARRREKSQVERVLPDEERARPIVRAIRIRVVAIEQGLVDAVVLKSHARQPSEALRDIRAGDADQVEARGHLVLGLDNGRMDPGMSQIVGHAIHERGLGGEALEALEEQELGPAVEDDPVGGGDEGLDAEGQLAIAAKQPHRRPVEEARTEVRRLPRRVPRVARHAVGLDEPVRLRARPAGEVAPLAERGREPAQVGGDEEDVPAGPGEGLRKEVKANLARRLPVLARDEHDAARGGRGRCHAPSVGDSPAATQDQEADAGVLR